LLLLLCWGLLLLLPGELLLRLLWLLLRLHLRLSGCAGSGVDQVGKQGGHLLLLLGATGFEQQCQGPRNVLERYLSGSNHAVQRCRALKAGQRLRSLLAALRRLLSLLLLRRVRLQQPLQLTYHLGGLRVVGRLHLLHTSQRRAQLLRSRSQGGGPSWRQPLRRRQPWLLYTARASHRQRERQRWAAPRHLRCSWRLRQLVLLLRRERLVLLQWRLLILRLLLVLLLHTREPVRQRLGHGQRALRQCPLASRLLQPGRRAARRQPAAAVG
jgi:hypothetical protein